MILSPAKTLDLAPLKSDNDDDEDDNNNDEAAVRSPSSSLQCTEPSCDPSKTSEIARAMKARSEPELAKLLGGLSKNLARTAHGYWKDFVVGDQDDNNDR